MWNSSFRILILQICVSITAIFNWTFGTCPLILFSHLSYFISLYPFALLSGGFGELYLAIILLSSFSLPHFNFQKFFYVLWILAFFLTDCSHFLIVIFSFLSLWDICSTLICHVLFPPCKGSVFPKSLFPSSFACLLFCVPMLSSTGIRAL